MTQFFFSQCTERKIESFGLKKLSHLSWVETKTFELKKKTFIVLVVQRVKASLVLHQNYCDIKYILNWFWKWF